MRLMGALDYHQKHCFDAICPCHDKLRYEQDLEDIFIPALVEETQKF
jgi:hypothetical protein